MCHPPHILLLAGSGEGRQIAGALAARDITVTASVVQDGHWSGDLPVPTRTGGFGGAEGFASYLQEAGITAVIDATHPFADQISARSWAICRELGVPYLQIDRPCWVPGPGDAWTEVADIARAAVRIPTGARVFATTGRALLEPLLDAGASRIFLRRLAEEQPMPEVRTVSYVFGTGPFSVDEERATFERLQIDLLLCKNSGGVASRSKLDAARALGLPVILLARPAPSGAPTVATVEEALAWLPCR